MTEDREQDLDDFYLLLAELRQRLGGARQLARCTAADGWPDRGVYFFFETGETRADGATPRVVRVGTHALTTTSSTTLWSRLRAHRGTVGGSRPGGGNHRGSIFRLHVGTALIARGELDDPPDTWGQGSSARGAVRDLEYELERRVSDVIGAMRVLWLDVPDRHDRDAIERGCIGLLSNWQREPVDPASDQWLGRSADRPEIGGSGLWNVHHVHVAPDPSVLRLVQLAVRRTGAST